MKSVIDETESVANGSVPGEIHHWTFLEEKLVTGIGNIR